MYRLLLVDDHVLFREGMATLIGRWRDFEVVGEANNGEEAVALARQMRPDVVLMDIAMPVLDGIQATELIMREVPAARVVILTMSDDDANLFRAVRAGAAGYVLKTIPSRRLHDELRGVLRGEVLLSGVMAAKILREFNLLQERQGSGPEAGAALTQPQGEASGRPGWPAAQRHDAAARGPADPLTEREREVLELLVEGLSNQEIADRICLSENTVKKHLHNVLSKLHLSNRVEAATYALRAGDAWRQAPTG